MRVLEGCRDRGDPRFPCRALERYPRGWTCRCEGRYRPAFETAWRVVDGDVVTFCPGCGTSYAGPPPRVTTFVTCSNCRAEWRVKGSPFWTALWRVFGKHEGYNRPSLWFAKTHYLSGDMAAKMERSARIG